MGSCNTRSARKDEAYTYSCEMNKSPIKVVEDAFSYAFKIGYNNANDELKNASFYFFETFLTEMAHRGTFEEMSERGVEK